MVDLKKLGKWAVVGAGGLWLVVMVVFITWGFTRSVVALGEEPRIVPWVAEEDSPYICFAGMRGKELLALECLDRSLTQQ